MIDRQQLRVGCDQPIRLPLPAARAGAARANPRTDRRFEHQRRGWHAAGIMGGNS